MKQKDIITLVVAVFFAILVSVLASKLIFASPKNRQQQVEVVPVITADFPTPDKQYFNGQSIDPTQLIEIGNNNNLTPFNGSSTQ